jgi:hypothetical protein
VLKGVEWSAMDVSERVFRKRLAKEDEKWLF